MASGGARRGRRDNGLVAAAYAVAGDVDPRVGEHLLDVLGLRGIAAYLQPAADLHPVTRTTTLPSRPTDRLYVDRDHLQVARDVLAELDTGADPAGPDRGPGRAGPAENTGPGPAPPATTTPPRGEAMAADRVDDMFASIVADFDTDHGTGAGPRPWPDAEDLAGGGPGGTGTRPGEGRHRDEAYREPRHGGEPTPATDTDEVPPPGETGSPGPRVLRRWTDSTLDPAGSEPSLLDGLDTFGTGLPGDASDEEGYTPPPPPPLPRITAVPVLAVLAIIGGIAVLVQPAILPIGESMAMAFGFAGIIGGFITLVARLRPGGDDDDPWDPDDGAVV